jgi:hypothetical protein
MAPDPTRFEAAVRAFDAANAEDPNSIWDGARQRPRELVQAERLSRWVKIRQPEAPEALLLAARCQHLKRWVIPRTSFPDGRVGYLQWRTELGRFHASEAERILRSVGYDETTIALVRKLNLKQGLRSDPNTQVIEDALCLAFLEHELAEFAQKHERAKVVDILRKTWKKISPRGRELALGLPFSPEAKALVDEALGESGNQRLE